MNNTSLFVDPVQTVHFLTVFSYLNSLKDTFNSENLTEKYDHVDPIIITNTYYEYLNKSKDEIATKRTLLSKLLNHTDLYGGGENETLDVEYVNKTFDYIISNAVFSQYGNIYGYLAEIVSQSNNLKLSSLKQEITNHLTNLEYFQKNGSVIHLSPMAVSRILETLVWPLFPVPEKDMRVNDNDFIYAQATLTYARSTREDITGHSFNRLVTISRTMMQSSLNDPLNQSELKVFTLPALMYYAHKKKESFKKQRVAHLIRNDDFWSEVFVVLFSHLNSEPSKTGNFDKKMFKSISAELIRTVDSGFELLGEMNRKFPKVGTNQTIEDEKKTFEIVGKVEGHEVFRKIYPGGKHLYGPRYIRLPEGTAEIRRTLDSQFGIPVIVSDVSKWGQVYYHKIDLGKNQTFGIKLKMDENGFLEPLSLRSYRLTKTGEVRKKLKEQRMKELERVAEVLSKSNLKISKEVAEATMKSYFLATEDELTKNENQIDQGKGRGGKVPTYEEFARSWVKNKKVDEVYEEWHINDLHQLDELLYDSKLDYINKKHVLAANDEIVALYGPFYQEEFEFYAANVSKYYDVNENQDLVNFVDFYAIANWITNFRFEMTENVDASRLRQIAFYRLAIRQIYADWLKFPKVLYRWEVADKYFVNKDLRKSNIFRTNRWLASSKNKNWTSPENSGKRHLLQHKDKVLVLYEIHIDSQYLTANLNSVVPNAEEGFLILPNVNFHIEDVTNEVVGDDQVLQVKMRNEPFDKQTWLRKMVKQLENIQKNGNRLQ